MFFVDCDRRFKDALGLHVCLLKFCEENLFMLHTYNCVMIMTSNYHVEPNDDLSNQYS